MTTQVTFNNFNVGKRGKWPNSSWSDYNISLEMNNQCYCTEYLSGNTHSPPPQILKSRVCAYFPRHQTIPPNAAKTDSCKCFILPVLARVHWRQVHVRAALSSAIFWPCFFHFLSQASATHNSLGIHQKIHTYPAHPRAACTCQSLQCLVASKVTDEGQPWTALLSKSTFGPHLSPSSSTSPAPSGGKKYLQKNVKKWTVIQRRYTLLLWGGKLGRWWWWILLTPSFLSKQKLLKISLCPQWQFNQRMTINCFKIVFLNPQKNK